MITALLVISGGSGGGVDGHQRHARVFHFAHAGIGGGRAWVGGEDFHGFRGVDRAAAAEGDNVIAARGFVRRIAFLHQLFGRVRENLIEQVISHLVRFQRRKQAIEQAEFDQLTVGDNQRFTPLFACDQVDHIADCARAVQADFGKG
jgi:hypothetical protein